MKDNRDLNADEVLYRCKFGVPPNVAVPVAVEAHCMATLAGDRQVMAYTLRAVIFARTPDLSDLQSQIDYLAGLPREAWDVLDSGDDTRGLTLDAIRRQIAWRQAS